MAYTSDTRVKNLLTDVDYNVRKKLEIIGINQNDLNFRCFDESDEDAISWEDGGLTFKDPKNGYDYGSNDCAWEISGSPILVVEGTFGTERGQFGNGQLNRVSHPVGAAVNGHIGVLLEPFTGHSYVKEGSFSDISSDNIYYQPGRLNKELALAAINFSKNCIGKFLIFDPYEIEKLENLLIELIKKYYNFKNNSDMLIEENLALLKKYIGNFEFGKNSKQKLDKVYFTDGTIKNASCRYFTHNYEALTDSKKRDGHGLFGKCLIEMSMAVDTCTFIFIRMSQEDFNNLRLRRSKEFSFIDNNSKMNIYNFDDLEFEDSDLKQRIFNIRKQNLLAQSDKKIQDEMQKAFNSGKIKIKV